MLLRITNDPESKNSRAIASNLRARISYCDEQWRELFPSIAGAWGDPDHTQRNGIIGNFYNDLSPVLKPLEFIHLGIALSYPRGDPLESYAFNGESRRYPNWRHPEQRLYGDTIHIKVTVNGDHLRETYYYVLKNLGTTEGLRLEPVSPPVS
jgi:hypothetical protein